MPVVRECGKSIENRADNFESKTSGKIYPFEKFQPNGMEESRTGWTNIDEENQEAS